MASLFIDTSHHPICALLDNEYNWMDCREGRSGRDNVFIHTSIEQMLEKHSMDIEQITSVFTMAGPGSYTGIRVAAGMADIFEWRGLSVFSCLHFEIPRLLGIERGLFMACAFKKEFFLYSWEEAYEEKRILGKTDFDREVSMAKKRNLPFFASFKGEFSDETMEMTSEMLKKNNRKIFLEMMKRKIRQTPWYYRHEDKEFTLSNGMIFT